MGVNEEQGVVVACDWPGCEKPACRACADEEVKLLLCWVHSRPEVRWKQADVWAALKLLKRVAAAAKRGGTDR